MNSSYDRVKYWRLKLAIEAVALQRKALHSSRWSHLNESGAFQLNDAANMLREAADLLNEVSRSILAELPQYSQSTSKISGARTDEVVREGRAA